MVCQKCGTELNEGAEFCSKCGTKAGNITIWHGKVFTKEDILLIIKCRSMFFYAWLLSSILYAIMMTDWIPPEIGFIIYIVTLIIYIITFFRLCIAEKENIILSFIVSILLLLPLINLIILIITLYRGTWIIKAAGIKIGFLGISQKSIDEFKKNEEGKNV